MHILNNEPHIELEYQQHIQLVSSILKLKRENNNQNLAETTFQLAYLV